MSLKVLFWHKKNKKLYSITSYINQQIHESLTVNISADRGAITAPKASVSRPIYDARPGETVRLTCQAEGRPTPVISWTMQGGRPLPDDASVVRYG